MRDPNTHFQSEVTLSQVDLYSASHTTNMYLLKRIEIHIEHV